MNLKPNQKEFVELIKSNDIQNVEDFINRFFDIDSGQEANRIVKEHLREISESGVHPSKYYVLKNVEKAQADILDFYGLLKTLIKWELLFEITNKNVIPFNYRFINQIGKLESNDIINAVLKDLSNKSYIPLPLFFTFCQNGYFTNDEIESNSINNERIKEEKDRNTALKWTKITAISSIVLSIGSALFQYLSYTNEREVKITSMPKSDTIKAEVVTKPIIQIDTSDVSEFIMK